jgi:hypothetical protein
MQFLSIPYTKHSYLYLQFDPRCLRFVGSLKYVKKNEENGGGGGEAHVP